MGFPYEAVGNRILELRKNRNMTREKLAELADISVQFLADIEKGKKNMTVTTLRKLAASLEVSTDYLVNGAGEPTEQELITVYQKLPAEKRVYALKILRAFSDSVK